MGEPALGAEWPKALYADGGPDFLDGLPVKTVIAHDLTEEEALIREGWRFNPIPAATDGDHDGHMGGSIDAFDQQSDEDLRALIEQRGASVHHRTGRARMLQILRDAA